MTKAKDVIVDVLEGTVAGAAMGAVEGAVMTAGKKFAGVEPKSENGNGKKSSGARSR